jgi:3D (Asp-Asp-Asp) domain-containing protein
MIKIAPVLAFLVFSCIWQVSCSSTETVAAATSNSARPTLSPTPGMYRKGKSIYTVVKTTAYCHKERDSRKYGRDCALGCDLRYDQVRSAAADWSVFPVGTLFRIPGHPCIYRVDDYGSALVGTRTIDLYQPTLRGVRAWGARVLEIEILKWGSYNKSLEIMADRTRHNHVRAMVTSIQRKGLAPRS